MGVLSRKDILDSKDEIEVIVDVPEWNGKVRLITMTGHARDKYEESIIGKNGGHNLVNIRAKLAAACIVNEEGQLQFTDKDIMILGKKSGKALDRVFAAAQKLNNVRDGDIEELAKN